MMVESIQKVNLASDDLKKYHEDGYLFYRQPILNHDEIEKLLREIDAIIHGEIEFPDYLVQFEDFSSREENEGSNENPVRKLQGLSYVLPIFEKLAKDPRIVDIVERMIGPDIKLYCDEYFCKNSMVGGKAFQPYHWHQDGAGYKFLAPQDKIVTCWIALDPATPENGCMQFIPKSHIYGPIAVSQRDKFLKHSILQEPIDATREPGHAIFHHGLNFHGSRANRSNQRRRSIAFHYMSSKTCYMGIDEGGLRKKVQIGQEGDGFKFMLIRGKEYEHCV